MTKRIWTTQDIIEAVQAWDRKGFPPGGIARADGPLYNACYRYFGSWQNAMVAAGLKPNSNRKWTCDRILDSIRAWHEKGVSPDQIRANDPSLCSTAARRFGTWRNALVAAGVPAGRQRRRPQNWTKGSVVDGIRAWQEKGQPVSTIWRVDSSLYAAAKRLFGSWNDALRAAKMPPTRNRWTKQRVIATLRARNGSALHPVRGLWTDTLSCAAHWHFGNRHAALRAAGIEPTASRRWRRETIIAALQDWHEAGLPTTSVYRDHKPLYAAATRRFGSWNAALKAAGLETRPRVKRHPEQVIEELRTHCRENQMQRHVLATHPQLVREAKRCFGSWRNALASAGLPYGEPRNSRRWNRERVIAALRPLVQQGLSPGAIQKADSGLYQAAKRHLGSWKKALEAAGYTTRLRRPWTREEIIAELKAARAEGVTSFSRDRRSLYDAATKTFGSLREALQAAGLPDQPRPRYWTEQRIVTEIREWQQKGLPLSHVGTQYRPLFRAAVRHLGGWRKALRAAGVESGSFEKWSREMILIKLQACRELTIAQIRKRHPKLDSAARYYFGSLQDALQAAAITPPPSCKWSKGLVVATIQDRYVRGASVRNARGQPQPLVRAARKHFGGWENALAAAGLLEQGAPRNSPHDVVRSRHKKRR